MATQVAVIQKPPVLLERDATIEGMLASIEEAASAGAPWTCADTIPDRISSR